jgi:hypothetical protein
MPTPGNNKQNKIPAPLAIVIMKVRIGKEAPQRKADL